MLHAGIDVHQGDFRLEAELTFAAGEVVAVLGPNGAGKSTLLRVLAGLTPIDGGRIMLGPRVLDDPATDTFVPPEDRPLGFVFQDHLLFPHLNARDNVAYGIRARDRRSRADEWLTRVGLANRGDARPTQLSGGESQRVALARALARAPEILLLDEPLSSLDAQTRNDVRRDLRSHLAEFSGVTVVVTHDPVDAFALADRLVVLEDGVVTHDGSPTDVSRRPRSRYVAELLGTNLVAGTCHDGTITTEDGGTLVAATTVEGAVLAVVAPEAVALHRHRPEGSPRNVWSGRVSSVDRAVDRVHVRVDGPVPLTAVVVPAAVTELGIEAGTEIWLSVKATEVEVHPL